MKSIITVFKVSYVKSVNKVFMKKEVITSISLVIVVYCIFWLVKSLYTVYVSAQLTRKQFLTYVQSGQMSYEQNIIISMGVLVTILSVSFIFKYKSIIDASRGSLK